MNIEYEPEQFPGMIIKDEGYSFLLFSSGKIILTGVKNMESIKPALYSFKEKIWNLRRISIASQDRVWNLQLI